MLHQPAGPPKGTLLLTHGAGSNAESKLLIAVADAFCSAGFAVLRYNLPFRQKRPSGPPRPGDAKDDQAGLQEQLTSLRDEHNGPIIAGGHSYGGRQISLLATDDSHVADALLLLSYPLHPPNKPAQLRTAHWPRLQTPALFLHGTKDPFGSVDEMRSSLALIPARTELLIKDKAGHDLAGGRFDLQRLLVEPFHAFLINGRNER